MIKIAIISSYAWIKKENNYGALFQYFALQKYLGKKKCNVFWIKSLVGILSGPRKYYYIYKRTRNICLFFNIIYCHHKFMIFVRNHLQLTKKKYTSNKQILKKPPLADFYITGSDQVWAGTLEPNYLTFVKDRSKKFAYAVSFGKDLIDESHKKIIKSWVNDFRKISVREEGGIAICQELAVDAIQVLDPTLLIAAKEYPTLQKRMVCDKYAFCYFLNFRSLSDLNWNQISKYIYDNDLSLKVASAQGGEKYIPRSNLVFPSPEEWLTYYRDAEVVFTNTFHGTVFAMIFRKPFVVIMQNGDYQKQNCRLFSILKMFNMQDRICSEKNKIEDILSKNINYEQFEIDLTGWRNKSDSFFEFLNH